MISTVNAALESTVTAIVAASTVTATVAASTVTAAAVTLNLQQLQRYPQLQLLLWHLIYSSCCGIYSYGGCCGI